MKQRSEFKAPWSAGLWGISLIASLVVLGMPIFIANSEIKSYVSPFFVPLLILIWLLTLLYTVRGYRLEKGRLFIRRLFWDTPVSLDGFQSAQLIGGDVVKGSIRLFGNGGLFAFCGWFWNRSMGRYRMWVTDTKRLVLIQCAGRKMVVSPDDPQEFVKAVERIRDA